MSRWLSKFAEKSPETAEQHADVIDTMAITSIVSARDIPVLGKLSAPPDQPCTVCQGGYFWSDDDSWYCHGCHPRPGGTETTLTVEGGTPKLRPIPDQNALHRAAQGATAGLALDAGAFVDALAPEDYADVVANPAQARKFAEILSQKVTDDAADYRRCGMGRCVECAHWKQGRCGINHARLDPARWRRCDNYAPSSTGNHRDGVHLHPDCARSTAND